MKKEEFRELIESSIGNKLIKASRLFRDYSLKELKLSFKQERLKSSHLQLFPHITFSGVTINEIAKKCEVSKQAVSVLVNELIEFKVLEKFENPKDKRSFLVRFNTKSHGSFLKGAKRMKETDQLLLSILGEKRACEFQKSLNLIIENI